MTLEEYLIELAWPKSELIRRTGLSPRTIERVETGEPVYLHTAAIIAKVLTEALGRRVTVDDIEGVNILKR